MLHYDIEKLFGTFVENDVSLKTPIHCRFGGREGWLRRLGDRGG